MKTLGPPMNKTQLWLGWLYLPIFAVLLPFALDRLSAAFGFSMSAAAQNLCCGSINLLFILAAYGKFLLRSLKAMFRQFWRFVQAVILGAALLWALTVLVGLLERVLPIPPNANDRFITGLFRQSRTAILLVSLLLAPIAEEVLFRGVVFGSAHRKFPFLAYVLSTLLFGLLHVWSYYAPGQYLSMLMALMTYIPAGAALAWTYEKAGNLWAPIALHILNNAVMCGITILPGR